MASFCFSHWPRVLAAPMLAGLLALGWTLMASTPVYAQTDGGSVTQTCPNYPHQPAPWSATCTINRFDPTLGTLAQVVITTTTGLSGTVLFENTSLTTTTTFNWTILAGVAVSNYVSSNFTASGNFNATLYDGVTDFGGTSGRTFIYTPTATVVNTVTNGTHLGQFTGAGVINLPINAGSGVYTGTQTPAGPSVSGLGSTPQSSALVTVTYLYNTPNLSATKIVTTPNFVVGTIGTYRIGVRNVGPGPTLGPIYVTDTLPTGLTFASGSGTGWSFPPPGSGPTLTFTRTSTLNAGAVSTITLNVNVTNTAIGTITNTVFMTTTRDLNSANNTAWVTTTVHPAANLAIAKSATPNPVNALGTLTYTLFITNLGPSLAPAVTVTDTLPAGLTATTILAPGWTCSGSSVVVCATTNLSINASSRITLTVLAPINGGVLTNTATVTTTAVDGTPSNNTATITTTVRALADLSVSKTAAPSPAYAGQPLTYTVLVTNAGPSLAYVVTVTDVLPAGMTGTASGSGWSCSGSTTLVCTRTNAAVGALPAILIATTAPTTTGTITNTVSVGANGGVIADPNPSNDTSSRVTTVLPAANLLVTKTDSPDPVVIGNPLTYTVRVTNTGPSPATGVFLTDTLPSGVTFVAATPGCTFSSGTLTCALGTLNAGDGALITLTVTAPATPAVITNTVTAQASPFDPNLANNTANAPTVVADALVDVRLTKSVTPSTVLAGSLFTYTLNVENLGPDTAYTVTVTDALPSGVSLVSVTAPGFTCTGSTFITCDRASLLVGAPVTLTLVVTAPAAPGPITNTAGVASATADTNFSNNTDAVMVNVLAVGELAVSVAAAPEPVWAAAPLTYTVQVTNLGPSLVNNVTLTNVLPAGVTLVSATGPGWSCTGVSTVVCTRTNLSVGAAPALTLVVTTPNEAGTLTFHSTVHGSALEFDLSDNTASRLSMVQARADLAVTKTAAPNPVTANSPLTYTVRVTNTGPSALTAVTLTDTLPAGVMLNSVTAPGWSCTGDPVVVCSWASSWPLNTSQTLTFNVTTPAEPTTLTNTVTVSGNHPDTNPANNTASVIVNVAAVADLSVSKTAAPNPVRVGDVLTYTLYVTNHGPSTASTLTLTDTLPAGVTLASVTAPGWSCSGTSTVVCTRASLTTDPASALTIVVTAPLTAGFITNTVSVASASIDLTPANNNASVSVNVTPFADLVLSKSAPANAIPGTLLTYTLVVNNLGPSPAPNATLTDLFPADLSGVTWTCVAAPGSACPASGTGHLNALPITVAVGAPLTITASGLIQPGATGTLTNTANVDEPVGVTDPDLGNNTASASTNLTPQADLSLTKTDHAASQIAGQTVTYTLVVANAGPSHANANLTDIFPASLSAVTWTCLATSGSACPASGSGHLNLALTVLAGGSVTVTASASLDVAATGTLTNTASVAPTGDLTDPNPANDTATDTSAIVPSADLTLSVTDDQTSAVPGTPTTYSLIAVNLGPNPANAAVLSATLPASLLNVAWTCSPAGGATCPASGLGAPNTPITLPVGASVVFNLSADIAPAARGTLTVTATLTAPAGLNDVDPANNFASDFTNLTPRNDWVITQSDLPDPVSLNGLLRYRMVITNTGPSTAESLTLTDTLPLNTTLDSFTGACVEVGSQLVCSWSNLGVGASRALNVYVVPTAYGFITNTAIVGGPWFDPNPANNTSHEVTLVQANVDATLTKSDGQTSAVPGSALTYTLVARNTSTFDVYGALLQDTLPASLHSAAWTCAALAPSACAMTSGVGHLNLLVDIAANDAVTVTLTANLATTATGSLINTATLSLPVGLTDPNPANNTATDINTLTPQADVSLTKTDGLTQTNAGGTLVYTLVAHNAGPSHAASVTLADTLPAGLTGATWTCAAAPGATCPASGTGNINATVSLGVNTTLTLTLTATVSASSGTLTNTASLAPTGGLTDPNPANNTATDTTDVIPAITSADLSLTFSNSQASSVPGLPLTYTLSAVNLSAGLVSGARITASLPSTLQAVSWTCANNGGSTCGTASGTGALDLLVNLNSGEPLMLMVYATLDPAATGVLLTQAFLTPPTGVTDPNTINNTATDADTLTPQADVSLTKTDGLTQTNAGGTLVYTLVAHNAGPSHAASVTLADTLPAGLTGATWTCAAAPGATCPASGTGNINATVSLGVNTTLTLTLTATVSASSGTLTNTASLAPTGGLTDPNPANNTATDTTDVIPTVSIADLSVSLTNAVTQVVAGWSTSYTLTVSNAGPNAASAATLTSPLTHLSQVTWTCAPSSGSACPASGTGLNLTGLTVAPGGTLTLMVQARVNGNAPNPLTVTVSVADPADPNPANNTASHTDEVIYLLFLPAVMR